VKPQGVLTPIQKRSETARRSLAAAGFKEAVTWSFMKQETAKLFGGGDERLVLANPIAADLDCMRPTALANLVEACGRNAARGFADAALYEVGPIYLGDGPKDQRTVVTAVVAPNPPRRWDGAKVDALFELKGELFALLQELGAPVGSLQIAQGATNAWWHPGRSARIQLGPKQVLAEFGELHPSVLKALDVSGPVYGFELVLDNVPEPKRKATKTKPALKLSPFMPLHRDFAFVVARDKAAGDLVRAVAGADKLLISDARVFDVYEGPGVPDGFKSVAVEIEVQPKDKTLTDVEIEQLSAKVVQAAEKLGAKLRA
jgi:phenylalanyl-tRNA synthetase beta chain